MQKLNLILALALSCIFLERTGTNAQVYRGGYRTGHAVVGPQGGVSTGRSRGSVRSGPLGTTSTRSKSRTVVTPGGTTVQTGRAGGVSSGPLGGTRAAGAKGVRVTTPGGQTYSHGAKGRASVGPYGGVSARGSSRTSVSGPFGGASVRRGGAVRIR